MQLAAYSNVGYLNEPKARSHTSAHIYLSEDVPIPQFNGAVITIAQIIKHIISSTAEAELASLFITARKCTEL